MSDTATPKAKDKALSHGAHEIRNTAAVIIGYLRMLTSDRMGAVTEPQRRVFSEMSKSAARLSALADEMTDLSQMLAGGTNFDRARVDLGALIEGEVAVLEPLPDREVRVSLQNEAPGATIVGDAAKLRRAMNAIINGHRRELVTSDELCVHIHRTSHEGRPVLQVTIGGADRIATLREVPPSDLVTFDGVRGGIGLSLFIAQRIVAAHGAQLWSVATQVPSLEPPADGTEPATVTNTKAAAVLFFPEA